MGKLVVGLISDTHLGALTPELLAVLEDHLSDAAFVIHAGDVTSPLVLEELEARGWDVRAVQGNMDTFLGPDVPQKRVLDLEGLRVGVAHGWGPPSGIRQRVLSLFQERPDILVYGHTHHPDDTVEQQVRFINPGSPTDRRFAPYRSVGRLEISWSDDGRPRVDFQLVRLD